MSEPQKPRLSDVEARAEAATEGPWTTGRSAIKRSDLVVIGPSHLPAPYIAHYVRDDDATFIAASRTDVPALTAAIRAVLAIHFTVHTVVSGNPPLPCRSCGHPMPCPTVRTLSRHIDLAES